MPVAIHHGAARRRAASTNVRLLSAMSLSLVMLAGILLLVAADGSSRDVRHDVAPMILVGGSFLATLLIMGIASGAERMQLGLQMLTIYVAVFLLLPGYNHISKTTFPFYNLHYDSYTIRRSAVIIATFLAAVVVGYFVLAPINAPVVGQSANANRIRVRFNTYLVLIMTFTAFVSMIAFLGVVGISGAFQRRGADTVSNLDALGAGVGVSLPRAMTTATLIYTFLLYRFSDNRRVAMLMLGINVPIYLVTNWPLALARFVLFGNILIFVVLAFDFRRKLARVLLPIMFAAGALVLMPLADTLTRGAQEGRSFNYSQMLGTYFSSGDFDGVQSTNNAVLYTHKSGYQDGRQLLSASLFFVPRSIWSGKGLPTGSLTAEAAGFKFLNISQPLPSEFYVDFGLLGDVIGGIVVGFALARIDRWIDDRWHSDLRARLVASVLVGYSIIVYRGSLLAVVAGIVTLLGTMLLIAKIGIRPAISARTPLVRHLSPQPGAAPLPIRSRQTSRDEATSAELD